MKSTFRFHTGSIKRKLPNQLYHRLRQFRFHTGSIKSIAHRRSSSQGAMFRFHTGSIKSTVKARTDIRRDGFDSILVRLKGRYDNINVSFGPVSIPYWFD